jgi:Ca2+-binding EF-hand superfamily protein
MMTVAYRAIKLINEKARPNKNDAKEIEAKVAEFFTMYDYNNDNKISRDEFRSYIRTDS